MFADSGHTYEKPMKFLPVGPGRRNKPPPPKDYTTRLNTEELKEPPPKIITDSHVGMHCPTPECGVEVTDPNTPRFVCPRCGVVWCLRCKTKWHKGMTCEEYEQQSVQVAQNEMALAEIEKNSGLGYHALATSEGLEYNEARQMLLIQQNELSEMKENPSDQGTRLMMQMMNEQFELDELNQLMGIHNYDMEEEEKYASEKKKRNRHQAEKK